MNVTGDFNGTFPNQARIGGAQAPYILWNFATASTVTVNGGDSVEGTIYAPRASLNWIQTNNIEGNAIAATFQHGGPLAAAPPREIHDFPFATTLQCGAAVPALGQLTLRKEVINSDGSTGTPSEWTLTATGSSATVTGPGDSADVTEQSVPPGDYELSESGGPPDYKASGWICDGIPLTGSTVSVAAGDEEVCTITNRYDPATPTSTPTPTATSIVAPTPAPGGTGGAGESEANAELANTGTSVHWAAAGAGVSLIALGVVLLLRKKRHDPPTRSANR